MIAMDHDRRGAVPQEQRGRLAVTEILRALRDSLEHQLRSHPGVRSAVPGLEQAVLSGELTPALTARKILDTFLSAVGESEGT